jgi:hypothetical protein
MIIVVANQENKLKSIVELLSKVKKTLMEDDIAAEICNEFGFDVDIISGIPIEFDDSIESTAKTINSHIKLNTSLMDAEFEVIMRYAIHELVHALQHMTEEANEQENNAEYLDRDDELEAFQYQIEYESDARGPDVAEQYVDDLIEYHEIPEEEKEDKREELLDKVE